MVSHRELCKKLKFDHMNKCYIDNKEFSQLLTSVERLTNERVLHKIFLGGFARRAVVQTRPAFSKMSRASSAFP